MSSTAVRRTALAASAAALALLATACGGSSDDDGAAGDDKAKAEQSAPAGDAGQSAPAGKALTAAELEKVALAQADVKNGEVATELSADDQVAKSEISTDDKACLPLVHAQGAVAQGEPAADVQRSWQGQTESPSESKGPDGQDTTDVDVNKILLNVASYADGGAEQAMAGLKTAVEKCAGGYDATVGSDKMRVTEVSGVDRLKSGDEGAHRQRRSGHRWGRQRAHEARRGPQGLDPGHLQRGQPLRDDDRRGLRGPLGRRRRPGRQARLTHRSRADGVRTPVGISDFGHRTAPSGSLHRRSCS